MSRDARLSECRDIVRIGVTEGMRLVGNTAARHHVVDNLLRVWVASESASQIEERRNALDPPQPQKTRHTRS